MIEYKIIDSSTYKRKAHLDYFMSMVRPQVSITAMIDVTVLKQFCKQNNYSFFLTFMHIVDLSAEVIPEFRQRLHKLDDGTFEIREYIECPTSHTESTKDELYCYCAIHHHMPFNEYIKKATILQKEAREKGSLEEDNDIEAFFFSTCIPWIHYTDVVHPTVDQYDSNPRFSWGKFEENSQGKLLMPLTVMAHHGLVDGIHLGKFYTNIENNIKALLEGKL